DRLAARISPKSVRVLASRFAKKNHEPFTDFARSAIVSRSVLSLAKDCSGGNSRLSYLLWCGGRSFFDQETARGIEPTARFLTLLRATGGSRVSGRRARGLRAGGMPPLASFWVSGRGL